MNNCTPENKYPPHPCPCPEIPGPPGPPGPQGLIGPQGIPGDPASPGTEFDIWHTNNVAITTSVEFPNTSYTCPFSSIMSGVLTNPRYRYKGVKTLTARNLICQIATSSFIFGDTVSITVQKNGVDTLLTLGINSTNDAVDEIIEGTASTFTIATNDEIRIRVTSSMGGSGATVTLRYLTFQVDYPG